MLTIAYLTSQYARAGDTFIRGEVEQLRKLGFTIRPFSIRAPSEGELINDAVRRERQGTEDLVGAGLFCLVGSALSLAILHPFRLAGALWLAVQIGTPGLRGRLWPMAYLLEACLLARRMRANGVKHLHNHIGRNSAAVAMLASLLSNIPYSLTIHGPTEFDMPLLLALNKKVARSLFTVAVSRFGRSQLMRWTAPEHWHKIHVVRCGFSDEFKLAKTTDVPDVRRIVCVARFVEQKGHLILIEAIARLVKQGLTIELDLIGDGPLRFAIKAAIARHGLQRHIALLGWQSTGEVRLKIESSRGLVLPSFAEGLPVSLIEGMALARPVIGTNVGAISELIQHRKHGWLISAGSIDEMTVALNEMFDTPVEKLSEMGRKGREFVLQRHDAAREALKLASFITGCAPSSGTTGST
jgi:colanic acid/amylovoran biosynthesis glycosyltransferase